jgi:hypothetical protein
MCVGGIKTVLLTLGVRRRCQQRAPPTVRIAATECTRPQGAIEGCPGGAAIKTRPWRTKGERAVAAREMDIRRVLAGQRRVVTLVTGRRWDKLPGACRDSLPALFALVRSALGRHLSGPVQLFAKYRLRLALRRTRRPATAAVTRRQWLPTS